MRRDPNRLGHGRAGRTEQDQKVPRTCHSALPTQYLDSTNKTRTCRARRLNDADMASPTRRRFRAIDGFVAVLDNVERFGSVRERRTNTTVGSYFPVCAYVTPPRPTRSSLLSGDVVSGVPPANSNETRMRQLLEAEWQRTCGYSLAPDC